MKGKKFYLILVGLIVVGVASVFLYRQQQEARVLEFEGYEISEIENRVDALYNEDKTDIVENISEAELEELDMIFLDLKDQKFRKRNEQRLKDTELDFLMANEMNQLDLEIVDLFVEDDIIERDISMNEVDRLEKEIEIYESKSVYFERNSDVLENVRTQITDIERAIDFIDALFEEDVVRADITREDEEEALELINQIRNEEVKEELTDQVEIVSLALTEMEEALALEAEIEALEEEELEEDEEEELAEEFEEEEIEYIAPANEWESETSDSNSSWTPPSNSWSGGSGNSGSSTGSGGH